VCECTYKAQDCTIIDYRVDTGYDCTGLDGPTVRYRILCTEPYTVYCTVCERFAASKRESRERRGDVECGVLYSLERIDRP
jgi:hypothetical protein